MGKGAIMTCIKQAWLQADAEHTKQTGRAANAQDDSDEELPLDNRTARSLNERLYTLHKLTLPAAWEGTPPLLWKLWRTLRKRITKAEKITGVHTMESDAKLGGQPTKWLQMGSELDVRIKGKMHQDLEKSLYNL